VNRVATFGERAPGFHGEGIHSVVFDTTGRWLLVASRDALSLWTAASLERVAGLSRGPVYGGIGFTGDLAVALIDATLRFWSVPSGEPAGEIDVNVDPHGGLSTAFGLGVAAFSLRESQGIEVRDLVTREVRFRVPPLAGPPHYALRFSSDGGHLLVSNASTMEVWDVAKGTCVRQTPRGLDSSPSVLLPGGANALVVRRLDARGESSRRDDALTTFDEVSLENGSRVRRFLRPGNLGVGPIARTETPRCVVAVINAGVAVWKGDEPMRVDARKDDHRVWGRCKAIALSPDARMAVTGDTDGWLTRWDTATLARLDQKPELANGRLGQPHGSAIAVTGLAVPPDARFVLAVDERGGGVCRDIVDGVVAGRAAVGGRIMSVASAGADAFATLHDARHGAPAAGGFVCRLWTHALAMIGEMRVSHVSTLGPGLLAHAVGGRIEVIGLPDLERRSGFDLLAPPSALALSPDGTLLGWAVPEAPDQYRQIRCTVGTRNLATGTALNEYRIDHGQEYPISALAISADGALAAAWTTFVAMHDLALRRLHPRSHDSLFRAFGPERHVLAVGEDSLSLYVWDFAGEERRQTHELVHASRVRSVAWITATRLVTGCEDGTISVWDL